MGHIISSLSKWFFENKNVSLTEDEPVRLCKCQGNLVNILASLNILKLKS